MAVRTLQLVTMGAVPLPLMKALEEPLSTHLGILASQSRAPQPTPGYAFNKDRNQYYCYALMRRLVPMLDGSLTLLLGITDVDLFIPDSPFVFGEADRESRVGVISTHRLQEGGDAEVLKRRLQLETLRQAGHLVGLSFCEETRCVMSLSSTPGELDRRNLALCNVCRSELAKLNR